MVVTRLVLLTANGVDAPVATVVGVRQQDVATLTVAGVMIDQHEERTVSGATWLGELRTAAAGCGLSVLTPPIPQRVVISDASEAARGLDQWGSSEATGLGRIDSDHLALIEARWS